MTNLRESGRILYISSVDVSVGNGPGVNERQFILALYRAIGDQAHFLIPQPKDEVPDLPIGACTFSLPHRHHNPKYYLWHAFSQIRLANQVLSRRRFDLLVFRLDILPFAPLYITRRHRISYVIKTLGQGLLKALGEKGGWLGKSLLGVNRWIVRQLVINALVADACSVAMVGYLQRTLDISSNKIVWIDNAVNIDRFFPSSAANARRGLGLTKFDPVVGYIGGLPSERGARQLIEVAPRLLSKYPNLGLVIVGDGPGLGNLKKRTDELRIRNRCLFTGYVPFDKVPVYANALDVGVSINLRPDRRAASELKVRQYLACGKPAVVSAGSNDFVTVENFGSVVQPTDLETIAAELDRWLSLTADERSEFARKATQYMHDNLSMEIVVAKRFELWSERLQLQQHQ